jgi:DNA-binding response OmpR family regulator/anti-sigma regulatory factor (Ser/Thr protein kinase)
MQDAHVRSGAGVSMDDRKSSAETRDPLHNEANSPTPAPRKPATILVVDDEPLARQMFTDLLEAQGFRVITVGRGEEVFAFLSEVDLVLLDAMLPGRDGWSICREIKEQHDPLQPVIMVTARTAPDDVVRTFAAGADDYVAKPFHVAELAARIDSRLRVHRAELALKTATREMTELAHQNYDLYERASRDAEDRANLLRELDHRVRNNLSVIMGLLSMERNRKPPRSSGEALASLENRLRSFLLVYEALRRQNYRAVPVREIAEKMTQRLRNSLDPEQRVKLSITGDTQALDERQGFSLSLALNELLTNSLRHAFTDGREGVLEIRIGEQNGEFTLQVCDNGVGGAQSGTDVLGSGRSIVAALVENELNGRVTYDSTDKGTTVTLAFPRTLEHDDQYDDR